MMVNEIQDHLMQTIIPFWKNLRDNEYGGYYGYMTYDLAVDKKAVKGCILNSRIMWFFSNAYTLLKDESLLDEAKHAYEFLKNCCLDRVNGGIFWSIQYDGKPEDTTKHTYNQAFAIYALSSYYEASGDEEALSIAKELYHIVENKCTDEIGYLEAFNKEFHLIENDKLSENGIIADKTMNTLLHVFEAYTELYRVDHKQEVKEHLMWMMDLIADKIYNPKLHRQEVFFDDKWNSIIDLHSYGHDIETAWLVDRSVEVIGEKAYADKMTPITLDLARQVYETAFDGHSMANECDKGVVDTNRVWWVQAETVVGFLNAASKCGKSTIEGQKYLKAADAEWEFIKKYVIDHRDGYEAGREWYWLVNEDGRPYTDRPIVEPWKCPYHNGRMCFEVIKRLQSTK